MAGVERPRVLVCDDHAPSRYAFRRILTAADFDVIEAEDGRTARARASGLAVAILDVNLPDISGVDLCRELRAIEPDLPVILISASYRAAEKEKNWRAAGAAAFLEQPIKAEELLGTVRGLLR